MEVIKFRKIGDVNVTLLSFWEEEDDTDVSYEVRITDDNDVYDDILSSEVTESLVEAKHIFTRVVSEEIRKRARNKVYDNIDNQLEDIKKQQLKNIKKQKLRKKKLKYANYWKVDSIGY